MRQISDKQLRTYLQDTGLGGKKTEQLSKELSPSLFLRYLQTLRDTQLIIDSDNEQLQKILELQLKWNKADTRDKAPIFREMYKMASALTTKGSGWVHDPYTEKILKQILVSLPNLLSPISGSLGLAMTSAMEKYCITIHTGTPKVNAIAHKSAIPNKSIANTKKRNEADIKVAKKLQKLREDLIIAAQKWYDAGKDMVKPENAFRKDELFDTQLKWGAIKEKIGEKIVQELKMLEKDIDYVGSANGRLYGGTDANGRLYGGTEKNDKDKKIKDFDAKFRELINDMLPQAKKKAKKEVPTDIGARAITGEEIVAGTQLGRIIQEINAAIAKAGKNAGKSAGQISAEQIRVSYDHLGRGFIGYRDATKINQYQIQRRAELQNLRRGFAGGTLQIGRAKIDPSGRRSARERYTLNERMEYEASDFDERFSREKGRFEKHMRDADYDIYGVGTKVSDNTILPATIGREGVTVTVNSQLTVDGKVLAKTVNKVNARRKKQGVTR